MRNLCELDAWRLRTQQVHDLYGNWGDDTCGVFEVPYKARLYTVVASSGDGWDHVSVSRPDRCPTWEEMEFIKRKFFRDEETAMQLHVAVARHISVHPYTLHLWRPQQAAIPLPPLGMV